MKQCRDKAVEGPPDPPCDHWLPTFGCKPPMNATWIIGQLPGGFEERIHWADGGGEEQPPYRGWFRNAGPHHHVGVDAPLAWRPESGRCSRCLAELPAWPAS